jgi:hypothetical protein
LRVEFADRGSVLPVPRTEEELSLLGQQRLLLLGVFLDFLPLDRIFHI